MGTSKKPPKIAAEATPEVTAPKPRLLAGGNPQIANAEGDQAIQAYIAAMPGWKGDIGGRLDALIVRVVPRVSKSVKWNSPFYGINGEGWFLAIHCFAKYVKIAFFRGSALKPLPPGTSTQKHVRYLDIRENEELDEAQLADWIRQASRLPGAHGGKNSTAATKEPSRDSNDGGRREADLCQGCVARRPVPPLQLKPRRQRAARHRHP